MADFTQLNAAVDALTTAVNSAVTDLNALSADIAALKGSVDSTVQTQIDAAVAKLASIQSTLTTAVAANPA